MPSARASTPLRPAIDVGADVVPPHCFSLPATPHRHDGRGDTTGLWRFSRLCLLAPRLAISSVRSASDGDGGVAYSAPCPSSVPPATRSLAKFDFLAVLPPHRLPSPIARHGGTGRGLLVLAACLSARSLLPFRFLLRSICAGSVEDGVGRLSCLLGCCIFIYVDGGWDKRDGACQAFDCLDAPAHPLSSPSPASTHKRPRVFSSSFHCPDSLPLFFRRATPRSPLNHGGRGVAFLCVPFLR